MRRSSAYHTHADSDAGRRYAGADNGEVPDISDIFASMFAGRGANGRSRTAGRGAMRGEDQHFSLAAAFLDAVNGATTRLTLPDGRTLDVKIPPATTEGDILRLRGQGGEGSGAGGLRGDALIAIHITAHPYFHRDGADIRLDLPVSLKEAALGGFIEVPTPAGPVRTRIPQGSDSQTQLRLRGRGVPAHGMLPAGDLTATLRVMIGKPDAALEAFLRSWEPAVDADPRQTMGMER